MIDPDDRPDRLRSRRLDDPFRRRVAHSEHTIAITDVGPLVLTAPAER
ncbi:hypothetical protein JOE26_000104 [Rhodococcus coprophilus]|nr:hypothetical protein [Rhodococcus coprophilus]